jgi:hypothetical protein
MLPQNFRFIQQSSLAIDYTTDDANNALVFTFKMWKPNASGGVTWSDEQTVTYDDADLAADTVDTVGSAIDNSSDLYWGLEARITFTSDAVAPVLQIGIEASTDAGTTWPSAAADFDLEVHQVHAKTSISLPSAAAGAADTGTINWRVG